MASSQDAKRAVVAIGEKYGFVGEDIMEQIGQWNPSIRRTIEESMLAKDKLAAHSIKTLAKNIYGSDARFVFELLQNADDNRFTRARANGVLPSISFHVHPHRIVVECNEDGFTEKDLRAICSVGESTKSASRGYIGAKGIGFKSVFIAAWKVAIQSGHFSFYFKHEKGDLGLGMVLPVWENQAAALPGPLTRMTLHLHEQGEAQELEHLRQTIFRQLSELQHTSLLFLRNLRQISVAFYDEDGGLKSSKNFRVGDERDHTVLLETTSTRSASGNGSQTSTENKQYHVTRHMATNLSKSDNRDSANNTEAEVVLAFPLTSDSQPLIEQQEIFAFLPIRESNFKFLIHSDFDTSASRQDIVSTSLRNKSLIDGIAAAFIKAVLQFCEHPSLCYTWPQFLPSTTDKSSAFWSSLVQRIEDLVSQTPILRSRHKRGLRTIKNVHIIATIAADSDGASLFDDSVLDPFISTAYKRASVEALKPYGLHACHFFIIRNLLEADLANSQSRMKSPSTSEDWHSAVARLLTFFFTEKVKTAISKLRLCVILPLNDGLWVSANDGVIYLPTTAGIPIPPGVKKHVLDSTAVANADRRALFEHLGAVEASVSEVRKSVLEALYSPSSPKHVDVEKSRAQLHFLYLSHNSRQRGERLGQILLYKENNATGKTDEEDFYLHSNDPYGPEALLGPTDTWPGLEVTFLHPAYLEVSPSAPTAGHPSWKGWLYDHLGVRRRLRLISQNRHEISQQFTSVLDHHPAKWLGLFEYLWRHEESLFKEKQYLKEYLSGLQIDELCKPPLEVYCELKNSYLPLPHLQQQCRRFMGNDSTHFPFLSLEGNEDEEAFLTKWLFLHTKFQVRKEDDTRFLLDMLFRISNVESTSALTDKCRTIMDLYVAIETRSQGATDRQAAKDAIEHLFWETEEAVILIPARGAPEATWKAATSCRWKAPSGMVSLFPLEHLYSQVGNKDQMRILSRFFSKTLKIDDVSWRDLRGELAKLRDQGCDDLDRIRGLYLRTFEDDALIFVVKDGQAGWYKTSDCLWSSTTDISGKVTLNDDYEDLRELFVENLGVKTLTLQMVYDELLQTDAQASIDDVKATLWSLNALLQTEKELPDPVPLHRIPIFPVKYASGNLTLRTIGAGFAIVDNESLADKFRSRIKLLDFSREEVLRLKPFIRWVGLANNYLSAAVRESTSVAEADSRPVSTPIHDIKRKAHAISRIAAHFNSPRYKAGPSELYQLLRSAVTTETTGISSVLRISQDGRSTELETAIGDLHIDDSSSHLTFFVPRHKKAREICYLSALPINLASWLMRDPVTQIPDAVEEFAVRALVTILGADPASVDALLERLSIINISIPNEDVNVAEDEEDEASVAGRGDDAESLVQPMTPDTASNEREPAMPTETRLAPLSGTYPDLSSSDAEVTHTVSQRSHMAYHSVVQPHSMPSAYHATILQGSTSEDALYLRLLTKVVDAARQAVFPSQGIFDMSNLRDALPERSIDAWQGGFDGPDVESRFRSTSQLERDRKIGAAGELYMQDIHNARGHDEVYMILRVCNIERSDIGMCVYMDPERLRVDGRLEFTGETWSVVPSADSRRT
ncbi:conserved hypothetical protein [Verticillium alfalfae VaMs.102]|uniref:Protein NO VEIN C-terminal domain-containing protein n=1 Tax=Verticillium alfalfae (strain VaMs.102 / ATCC MYA-4576 / FGSC 10136) TaxID=526221 RepID=C9SLC1_VERA1|nr:conserved hypothetical protein [Verticillium alfalfae VaMs.102]EEY19489.1 conserved hypothetical protein [Verticillium alfalfae VaMs.102]